MVFYTFQYLTGKMTAKDHYDHHLGNFYSWMIGDFVEKQQEQEAFFSKNEIKPSKDKIAFDLGAGHGLQTFPLMNLGFKVKAVDFNRQLLNELGSRFTNGDLEIIEDELLNFLKQTPLKAELIICMGDTITHLQNLDEVEELVSEISTHLEPGGKVVFSFRDLTTELMAGQRFIPVRADDSRILSCFLEYFSDHVMVHDILYERQNEKWIQRVSAYPKLRLNAEILNSMLQRNQIRILKSEIINRMTYLIGQAN